MPARSEIGSSEPATPPKRCSLYLAFDRVEPCSGEGCIFFRVPGIDGCAVESWSPGVEADRPAAGWFLTRRLQAEDARARREVPLRSKDEPMRAATRSQLRARPGDHLVLGGHRLGESDRDGEILEAIGDDGRPPYRVRWGVNDHVSTVYPGSDAHIERLLAFSEPAPRSPRGRSAARASQRRDHRWGRGDLAAGAIRLGRALAELTPDEPEVHGLMAVMLVNDARRDARFAASSSGGSPSS